MGLFEIAQYIRAAQCWTKDFEGAPCIKPNIAHKALAAIQPVLDGDRKTTGGTLICGGCPRSPSAKIVIEPRKNSGVTGATVFLGEERRRERRRP